MNNLFSTFGNAVRATSIFLILWFALVVGIIMVIAQIQQSTLPLYISQLIAFITGGGLLSLGFMHQQNTMNGHT